jgi:hypothetical protein
MNMNSDPVWVQGGLGWVGGYRNPTRWLGHKASGLGPLLGSTEKGEKNQLGRWWVVGPHGLRIKKQLSNYNYFYKIEINLNSNQI